MRRSTRFNVGRVFFLNGLRSRRKRRRRRRRFNLGRVLVHNDAQRRMRRRRRFNVGRVLVLNNPPARVSRENRVALLAGRDGVESRPGV
jgi:hypothetical protein